MAGSPATAGGTDDALKICKLEADQLDAYRSLRIAALQDHPDSFSSDVTEAVGKDAASYLGRLGLDRPEGGHFTLAAWQHGELVGAVSCEREQRIKTRHIGHLVGMMVRSDRAGRGIGKALLDATVVQARAAEGLEMLTLSVTSSNLTAVRLYQRAGFVRYASLPNAIKVDGHYVPKDQMVLVL